MNFDSKIFRIVQASLEEENDVKDLVGWYGTKENSDKEAVEMLYMPEFSNIEKCPSCFREVDIGVQFINEKSCPHCGQPFVMSLWIT